MNGTGKRLGFALVFTGFVITFNIYAVLNGSAERFYEGVNSVLLGDDRQTAEVNLQPDYPAFDNDCSQLAELRNNAAKATSVRHTPCSDKDPIGI